MDLIRNNFVIVSLSILLSGLCSWGQRPFPLENAYLRNDLNVNSNSLTNVRDIVFKGEGTNLTVDIETFLMLFEGVSRKLIDPETVASFLVVSNGIPYMVTESNSVPVVLSSTTSFIRQYDSDAYVTNMTVLSDLILLQEDGDSFPPDFAVTYRGITNGTLEKAVIEDVSVQTLSLAGVSYGVTSFNVVTGNIVTNLLYSLPSGNVGNFEWSYLVRNGNDARTGKIVFAVASDGTSRFVNVPEVIYDLSDAGLAGYTIEVAVTGNDVNAVLSGAGSWEIYSQSWIIGE